MFRRLAALGLVVFALACNGTNNFTTTTLSTPLGLTVAGLNSSPLVYVANSDEDTLQMLRIPYWISDTNFVRGPARYFPLRVVVGARPTKLASSDVDGTLADANGNVVGGRKYVIVLDTARDTEGAPIASLTELSLVDAVEQVPQVDVNSTPIHFPFADQGMIATDMVGSPVPCAGLPNATANCQGRVYVAMEESGTVLAIDLAPPIDAAGNKIEGDWFTISASYAIGGYPHQLAVSRDGAYLFAGDSHDSKVTRIGVGTAVQGSVDQRDIGGIPGPLAVSRDNTMLLVGRPVERDIIVMTGANDGTWDVLDANGIYAPQPRCLFECNGDGTSCEGAYLSDYEICVDNNGLQGSTSASYAGIYLDSVPAQIITLGQAEADGTSDPQDAEGYSNLPLFYDCNSVDYDTNNDGQISSSEADRDSTISVAYDEYALVVTEGDRLTGNIFWMPLKSKNGGIAAPLVANGTCEKTSIDVGATYTLTGAVYSGAFANYNIGLYLSECVDAPERNRFQCYSDPDGGGFIVLPGNTPVTSSSLDGPIAHSTSINFRWEGILQGLDRNNGGGQLVDDDGTADLTATVAGSDVSVPATQTFTDVGLDYSSFERIQPGDILQILNTPTTDASCSAVLADQGLGRDICYFERHIVSISPRSDGLPAMVFDGPPIPLSCFLNQGRVAYRVRAGHQFLIDRDNAAAWRMKLGERFGPGGDTGTTEPVIFEFRSDLLDTSTEISACNRYDEDGNVINQKTFGGAVVDSDGAAQTNSCDGYLNGSNPPTEVDCDTIADDDPEAPYCLGYCQSGILGREVGWSFLVYDPYRPYIGGRSYGSTGTATSAVSSIPSGIALFQDQNSDAGERATYDSSTRKHARVFVTFAGTNTLLVLDPTNAQNATTGVDEVQLNLRN